jgi:electron transport complex protein RnfD
MILWQGPRFAVQLIITITCALLFEAIILRIRHKPIKPFITDGTAIITAILMTIGIPASAPLWVGIVGIFFAIVIAKQLYGGLGHNLFNPAMVGYAIILISFPQYMTDWHLMYDGISQATPLDLHQSGLGSPSLASPWLTPLLYTNIAWMAGGLVLVMAKVVDWRIPLSFLAAVIIVGSNTDLLLGATMVGAFFIASDPVTAPAHPLGRLIYGAVAGALMIIIRNYASYPDGLAFAILLSNALTPLIDYRMKKP